MDALLVATWIAMVIIGLIVVVELGAMAAVLFRVARIVQQVRDKVDPVVDASTRLLQTANDMAKTVRADTKRVTASVAGTTERLSMRLDDTADRFRDTTAAVAGQLTRPPVLTGLALLTGLGLLTAVRRLVTWPAMTATALLIGLPTALRVWQTYQQQRPDRRAPLVLRKPMEPGAQAA